MSLDTASYALPVARTVEDLRAVVEGWKSEGLRVGFVPTMGALHEGHLSLVDIASSHADKVVVSIFVNPTQFAPHEDLDAYPRTEKADAKALADHPAHLIYAPTARVMYPDGHATAVEVGGPSAGLETDFRPHFFRGVATVVAKLFLQVRPDMAVFGEKDYQQLKVVTRMAEDLHLGIEVIGAPIAREWDGLAMSSRNTYLSEDERKRAGQMYAAINEVARCLKEGESIKAAQASGIEILKAAGFDPVDYVEVRDPDSLAPLEGTPTRARILAAAKLGTTRLIDNIGFEA